MSELPGTAAGDQLAELFQLLLEVATHVLLVANEFEQQNIATINVVMKLLLLRLKIDFIVCDVIDLMFVVIDTMFIECFVGIVLGFERCVF